MLYISVTQSTVVDVTLYEKSSNIVDPNYTWKLTNSQTNKVTLFTQENSSSSPYYQSFTVSVSGVPGLTAGTIDVQAGQYVYEIYETEEPYTLVLSGDEPLVETGILNVIGDESTLKQYNGETPGYIKAYGRV